jgi:hypothetical protein
MRQEYIIAIHYLEVVCAFEQYLVDIHLLIC